MKTVEVTDANKLYYGYRYIYKGEGNIEEGARYDAEIVGMTDRLITLEITAHQHTLHNMSFGDPIPYKRTIQKKMLGKTQHLWERRYYEGN